MDLSAKRNHLLAQLQQLPDATFNELYRYYQYLMFRENPTEQTSIEAYNQEVLNAKERVDAGQFTTHEELLRQMDQW